MSGESETEGRSDGATAPGKPRRPDGGPAVEDLDRAVAAVAEGGLVVYPTETVYGLGADALDAGAVERVFERKRRPRDEPISMAVASVEAVTEYGRLGARERAFVDAFLPGPVTVVCQRRGLVPDALTAGGERVGIRVPDHETALALIERTGPLTATSANVTGEPAPRRVADLDERIRTGVSAVVDGGETPGGGSTVVDVSRGEIHRRGRLADRVRAWLADPPV